MILSSAMVIYLTCAALGNESAEQDPYTGAIQVFHYSFENDQDRDFDRQPDDWTRRKGPGFPFYVKAEIDPKRGQGGSSQSLGFHVNGGPVIFYSPQVRIDDLHSYVFEGHVRTQMLKHDAAVVSISFLNENRQRVQRILSRPVTGTHRDWVRIRVGPVEPVEGVRYVVIGCHLVNGRKMDIRGKVWFDNLWLGKLPQMSLVSNFHTHFKRRHAPIEVNSNLSGLDQVLLFSSQIDSDTEAEIISNLDEGRIPAELKQFFAEREIILPDSAGVRDHPEGGWLISDGNRDYLVLYEQSQFEVYDANSSYQLHLQITDTANQETGSTVYDLEAGHPRKRGGLDEGVGNRIIKPWVLKPHEYGFYQVNATLKRNGEAILRKKTTFAVLDLVGAGERGEFGWSMTRGPREMPLTELADAASQAGIRWLKFPLWESVYLDEPASPIEIARFFSLLSLRGMTPIGLLSNPPPEIRNQFARDWTGISEIFTMPNKFWSPSLEPVLARYSAHVQHWQLGDDYDTSFIGLNTLPETITRIKKEFDQIGRNTRIGLPWDWDKPIPANLRSSDAFMFLASKELQSGPELIDRLSETSQSPLPRWVLLKPLERSGHSAEERGADLVKKIVAAKIGRAEGIFAYDVFDEEFGLLEPNGAPAPLFLPWRTVALALGGANYLGSFNLPSGSENFAFAKENEVVLIIWNSKPKTDYIFLGEGATVTGIWGRQIPLEVDPKTRQQILNVGPTPLVIGGCSRPIAEWQLAARFQSDRLESKHGPQPVEILARNTFAQGVNGSVTLNVPPEWQVNPRQWTFQIAPEENLEIPLQISLPPNASLGNTQVSMDFNVSADRPYKFRVYRNFQVGFGEIQLIVTDRKRKDGSLEIEQLIINNTEAPTEVLNFACSLSIPGQIRQKRFVTKLGKGKDTKIYVLPNAEALRGKTLRLTAEQVDGRRVLNKEWVVGKSWDEMNTDSNSETLPQP